MKESNFKFKPQEVPTDAGCYLYWDDEGKLLYVGKAKHLRKRVSSYFQKTNQSPKTQLMVSKIAKIETRSVGTEIEALILENNLIKEYRPRFNILMRDDKNFLYLRVTNETEPKLEMVRRVVKDGSTYIGPKTSARDFRDTIKFCQKFFGVKMVKPGQDYYINQLTGHKTSPEEYKLNIERMKRFLKGNTSEIKKEIKEKMMEFAREQKFEAAAKLRDTLESIERSTQKQTVEFADLIDRDFVNFHRDGKDIFLVRMAFRQGRFRDLNQLKFRGEELNEDTDVIRQFLAQFYEKVTDFPREIMLPVELPDADAMEKFLSQAFFNQQRVELIVPQIGDKKKVLALAAINARNQCEKNKVATLSQAENFSKALPELAAALELKTPPERIECYDISHLSGTHTVASMVVFENGKPKNAEYRRFKIKSLEKDKVDDFASMEEVLRRRFERTQPAPKHASELIMRAVESDADWDAYHSIRETEIFKPHFGPDFEYDREHKDEFKPKNHPMVFCLAEEIVGVVRLDRSTKTRLIMRVFGFQKTHQNQGHGSVAIQLIEQYALDNGFKSLVLNAHESAIKFYEKKGFEKDFWKGDGRPEHTNPMGKKLQVKKEKWVLPDLVVIDGGKGQLSSVMKVFKTLEVEGFDPQTQVISLAKREEQIFRPGNTTPIELSFDSAALKLLQRLRDEAHRFAISFNRSLRAKSQTKSILDEISGIGGTTKKKLMQTFETVRGIREADDEALLKVINKKQLENLRRQL
jgi:excinuclease ABC subunit C